VSFTEINEFDVTLAERAGEFHTLTRSGKPLQRIEDESLLAQFGWRDGRSIVIAETNPYQYQVHLYVIDEGGKVRGKFNLPGWSLPGMLIRAEGEPEDVIALVDKDGRRRRLQLTEKRGMFGGAVFSLKTA
jgi:hypothetical protein